MNPNWIRWIVASVNKHFEAQLVGYELHYEGQHYETKTVRTTIEVRTDGPHFAEICKDVWQLKLEINLLAQVLMSDKDFYEPERVKGRLAAAMTDYIIIKEYGDGEETVGCLTRIDNADGIKGDWIAVNSFGQIEAVTKLIQFSVEAHYQMELTDG
jgi:hypothetical protein